MGEVLAKGIPDDTSDPMWLRLGGMKPNQYADYFSRTFFHTTESILLRAQNLVSLLKSNTIAQKRPGELSAQAGIIKMILLSSILEVPIVRQSPLFVASKYSILCMYLYACLGFLAFYRDTRIMKFSVKTLDSIHRVFGINLDEESNVIASRFEVLKNPGNLDLLVSMKKTVGNSAFEKCGICGDSVGFMDLMSARCGKGHLFRRCALTFIMISDAHPRVCGICKREYITERMVEEDERVMKEERERMKFEDGGGPSLIRTIFDSVDTCVYCGGCFYEKGVY